MLESRRWCVRFCSAEGIVELTTILSDRTDAVRLMGGYEVYPSLGENIIEWIAVVGEISNKLFWLGVDEASIKSCFDERHLMGTG